MRQIINRGTPGGNNGDKLYDSAQKLNDNFEELYNQNFKQAGVYYFVCKGFNEAGQPNEGDPGEVGDFYEGAINPTTYVGLAKFLGGNLLNTEDFEILHLIPL